MTTLSSTESRLSSSDALMLRIETDAVLRSPVVVVGLLDRVPSHDAATEHLARTIAAIPRLRQRIQSGPLGVLRWVDDPAFSLQHHLRFARVAPHAGLREVLDLAAPDATAPFDSERPPWQLTLVEGLGAGRAAFMLRFHHAITDGVGGVDLARTLFDVDSAGRNADIAETAPAEAGARHEAEASPHVLAEVVQLARSVARMLAPADAPLSPLLVGRGLDRHLDAIDVPLASLRRAADVLGVTLNEAFLTAVTAALHDYHARAGCPVPALRVTMPISIRADSDAPGGNRFVPVRFIMPIDEPAVALRAKVVAAAVRAQRREPAIGLADLLANGLALLPAPAVTRVFASMLRNVDVDVVDVPGLERPAFFAGALVTDMWAFAPPTGAALSVTLLSHGPKCCIAALSDVAAVKDPALLTTCLEHAMAEVVALGDQDDDDEGLQS